MTVPFYRDAVILNWFFVEEHTTILLLLSFYENEFYYALLFSEYKVSTPKSKSMGTQTKKSKLKWSLVKDIETRAAWICIDKIACLMAIGKDRWWFGKCHCKKIVSEVRPVRQFHSVFCHSGGVVVYVVICRWWVWVLYYILCEIASFLDVGRSLENATTTIWEEGHIAWLGRWSHCKIS